MNLENYKSLSYLNGEGYELIKEDSKLYAYFDFYNAVDCIKIIGASSISFEWKGKIKSYGIFTYPIRAVIQYCIIIQITLFLGLF